jgi:UDP-glucose 4-epimerase
VRALVTGGAGFIGSHLSERLVADGYAVDVLDDGSAASWRNLTALQGEPRCTLHVGSVTDAALVDLLVGSSDVVFHLAGVVGVSNVLADPVRTLSVSVEGTRVVADASLRHGSALVFSSSGEVYGIGAGVPQREDAPCLYRHLAGGRSSYPFGKLFGEEYLLSLHDCSSLPVAIARLFNVAGPRQRPSSGMVIPMMVQQALDGEPVTVHGDGRQSRTFLHVDDVVTALLALLPHNRTEPVVVNVGSDAEVTMGDLAALIVGRTGSASSVRFVPSERAGRTRDDLHRRLPDLTRLRSLIGWAPRRSLTEIVDDVIAELS